MFKRKILWLNFLLFTIVSIFAKRKLNAKLPEANILSELEQLNNTCVDNAMGFDWWTYSWCYGDAVYQMHYDNRNRELEAVNVLGRFIPEESTVVHHIYREEHATCRAKGETELKRRYTEVSIDCCQPNIRALRSSSHSQYAEGESSQTAIPPVAPKPDRRLLSSPLAHVTYLDSVEEKEPCSYYVAACSELVCAHRDPNQLAAAYTLQKDTTGTQKTSPQQQSAEQPRAPQQSLPSLDPWAFPSEQEQADLRDRAKALFYHAYDSYMLHAFPQAELKPLSCSGGEFDLIKVPLVTLVDTLDTLVIVGNYTEFRRAVQVVSEGLPQGFDFDVAVSVFETTIRLLGGLLSAHLLATDPSLRIYQHPLEPGSAEIAPYDGRLLTLAIDLGERLLPAFLTKTGIPFGTVNLRQGVPRGETKIASLAGAGSLLVEFQVLSYLSGDERFGEAAFAATEALFLRRSNIGLLGKHINTETGKWQEVVSGVGSNSDSFYEYLLKAYLLFRREELFEMFTDTYRAIKQFLVVGNNWFSEVDMFSGKITRKRMENLDAFWPGVEAMLGFSHLGADQLNTFYSVWSDLGFLPEEFDYSQWQLGKGAVNAFYPLRPELIESTYHQYRSTGDRSWLLAGQLFLESIETFTRTKCGYASVGNVAKMTLQDSMPSFFLSETAKYLFLLFDEDNFINHRPYIFSTEAHPFDSVQLHLNDRRASGFLNTTRVRSALGGSPHGHPEQTLLKLINPAPAPIPNPTHSGPLKKQLEQHFERLALSSGKQQKLGHGRANAKTTKPSDTGKAGKLETRTGRTETPHLLPLKCEKPHWWDASKSYDALYLSAENRLLRNEGNKKRLKSDKKTMSDPRPGDPLFDPRVQAERGNRGLALFLSLLLDRIALSKQRLDRGEPPLDDEGSWTSFSSSSIRRKEGQGGRASLGVRAVEGRRDGCPLYHAPKAPAPSKVVERETSPVDVAALKSVDVDMGSLGEFNVKVYPDGFLVHSRQDRSSIDISNIGNENVLVREYFPPVKGEKEEPRANVIMGGFDSHTTECRVQVLVNATCPYLPDDMMMEIVFWDRPCSTAAFGPTHKSHRVRAPLFVPDAPEALFCDPRDGEAQRDRLKLQQLATNSDQRRKWWPWSFQQQQQEQEQSQPEQPSSEQQFAGKEGDSGSRSLLSGSLVLVDRGECMFEDKALTAHRKGGVAVLVRNNEDHLFMMAGKKAVEGLRKSKPLKPLPEDPNPVSIPTVMLTKTDATDLASLISAQTVARDTRAAIGLDQHLQQMSGVDNLVVQTTVEHMLLQSEFMGDTRFPKLWIRNNLILLIGSGEWGALLTATAEKEGDWQLYLMHRQDMTNVNLLPALEIRTEGGQPKDVSATVVQDPLVMYTMTNARKCPDVLVSLGGELRLRSQRRDGTAPVRSEDTDRFI